MKQNTSISLEEVIASQNTKERDYWVDKMTGSLVRSFFPYDYKKNDARNQKRTMKNLESSITGDIFTKLMEIINNSDYRLHMALTAALIVLLSKYTRNKDIIIGTPIYTPEIEGTFVNTILALRDQVVPGMNYKELLLNVRETIRGAVENQNYPIKALPYHLNLATSDMEFALFDVVLLLENIQQEKFIYPSMPNIIFSLHRKEKELNINVCYNSNLYEEITIKRIADHFINLMRQVVFNINMRISEIDILTEKEKTQVLYDFNHTEADYPKDKTIHQLFEEQAKRTPDRISVSYDVELETIRKQKDLTVSIDITYEELNKRANRLAYFLKSKGLKPDILVGLMTDRSLEMLSGILGILKSGGAY
ncbi:MAG: condensation domain-containing protein, partial [Acidobacteria bacterium]|nr:condensation domain-containing protein [Acidobacteriota bacterium]